MQKTTKHLALSALALGLITLATSASAAIATTGIATTRHNLGTSNRDSSGLTTPSGAARDGDLFTSGTDEICVFCHTPHASNTAANAPIWNKALPNSANYTLYSSGTMQGTASLSSGSMSLACLSCHDGTQAMDNMINQPGGSGYNASGASLPGTWSNLTDTSGGVMQAGAGIVMLGTDLSNDHPVGIPYCGGGAAAAGSNSGCKDLDFNAPQNSGSGGFVVGTDPIQKNNMRLYGSSVASATVECASCHDPHNDVNKTFLRVSNGGSAVCLTCHAK